MQQDSKLIQITSIEPTHSISTLVAESAQRHELAVELADTVSFSAPFCGNEYFSLEIRLLPEPGNVAPRFDECLEEIQNMVERELADGYIETL